VPRNSTGKKLWRIEELPIIPETWIMRPRDDVEKQLATIGRLLQQHPFGSYVRTTPTIRPRQV